MKKVIYDVEETAEQGLDYLMGNSDFKYCATFVLISGENGRREPQINVPITTEIDQWRYIKTLGSYGDIPEKSLFVVNMSVNHAIWFASLYGQESFIVGYPKSSNNVRSKRNAAGKVEEIVKEGDFIWHETNFEIDERRSYNGIKIYKYYPTMNKYIAKIYTDPNKQYVTFFADKGSFEIPFDELKDINSDLDKRIETFKAKSEKRIADSHVDYDKVIISKAVSDEVSERLRDFLLRVRYNKDANFKDYRRRCQLYGLDDARRQAEIERNMNNYKMKHMNNKNRKGE